MLGSPGSTKSDRPLEGLPFDEEGHTGALGPACMLP